MSFKPALATTFGQSALSPFRPGSIFYSEPANSDHPDNAMAASATPTPAATATEPKTRPPQPRTENPAAVSLASPPPSPSRNSIFDQPWSTTAGPNITSLRAATTPAASTSITTRNTDPSIPASTNSPGNYGSKINLHSGTHGLSGSKKIMNASPLNPSGIINSKTPRNGSEEPLQRPALFDAPGRRTSAPGSPTTVARPRADLLSPVHVPRSLPSPSLSPSSSMHLPPPSFFGLPIQQSIHGPTNSDSSQAAEESVFDFALSLDCCKANLLGHGRHAEVYKAFIHPSSVLMRRYLLSRRAMRTMSCKDLFQPSKEAAEEGPFICAAKCLSSDADSQAVGLAEAEILKRLHTQQSEHPGRHHLVDYFGLYDQATKRAISTVDSVGHNLAVRSNHQECEWALLLEYCQHGSIWDWIRQHPERVGFRQWLAWALQLLQAVECIHEAGLVHHDIKPHNILLDASLDAKLSDFGAGRFLDVNTALLDNAGAPAQLELEEGRGRGTPPYSAPEMFASASPNARYGRGIDIYSLGVSLYVIGLTAQEPFHKLKSMMEMIVWIKKGGFWLWEDQGWVHDRGLVPKVTPSSRLSTSSAALAQAQTSLGQTLECKESKQALLRSSRSSSTSSSAITPSLPPINTQLGCDRSTLAPSSACSTKDSPMLHPLGPSNHFLSGYSPESTYRSSLPSTPVSPLPLPSPIVRSQTPRSSTRKEEQRKSGEIVMRFLNGEVVQPDVILLLKDMCHSDPSRRPDAKTVLERLQAMKTLLDAETDMDVDADDDADPDVQECSREGR